MPSQPSQPPPPSQPEDIPAPQPEDTPVDVPAETGDQPAGADTPRFIIRGVVWLQAPKASAKPAEAPVAEDTAPPVPADDTAPAANPVPAAAGVTRRASHQFVVDQTRVTVTVEPTAAEKQLLAVSSDAPAELHVPICDLGDVASFTPDIRTAVAGALSTVAASTPPLSGTVAGAAFLESKGVTVGIVDCPGLGALHQAIADALYDQAGDDTEFLPAIVLSSGSVDGTRIAGTPVHFSEIRVRAGGETLVFDLLGPIDAAPAPEELAPEAPPAPAEPAPETPPAPPLEDQTMYRSTAQFAEPGMIPDDQIPDDTPPPPSLVDITDEELEGEIARRAAKVAADSTGGTPDDLLAAAEEQTAGLIEEVAAELGDEPPPDDTPPPDGGGEVPGADTMMAGRRRQFGDLAPDANGDGIGEAAGTAFDWEGVLAIEGIPTSDGRMFAEGAITHRTLPLTLALQTVTAPGHDGAVVCGSICEIERVGNLIVGRGRFSSTEAGDLARTLLGEGSLRGVSVDVAGAVVVYTDGTGNELTEEDLWSGDVAGMVTAVFTEAEVMGATLTPWQAFADAHIGLLDPEATSLVAVAGKPGEYRLTGPALFHSARNTEALVASAAPTIQAPPASVFALKPDTREPFSVGSPLPDGTIPVYGLLADWNIPHIGFDGRKVYAPRGDDFAMFYNGKHVITREGTRIPTGPIFVNTVHPNLALNASDAQAWYAHDGAAVADVHLYNAEHGIVAAGVIRPGTDDLMEYRFRGSDVSPDWRPIKGQHRMVAILAVNASGFPVPYVEGIAASAGRVRSLVAYNETTGEPLAMVAVGSVRRKPQAREVIADLQAQLRDQAARLASMEAAWVKHQAPIAAADRQARARAALAQIGVPVELSADERVARARAALATMGLEPAPTS